VSSSTRLRNRAVDASDGPLKGPRGLRAEHSIYAHALPA
jgi:hypothetical protein